MDIISRTQSICPVCRKPIDAHYVREVAEGADVESCGCREEGGNFHGDDVGIADGECCCCGEDGEYIEADAGCSEPDGRVYFQQECPEHGTFRTLASESAADFERWVRNPVINIPPRQAITEGDPEDRSCPLHCGTCENHLQTTCCVLIDVTQRCNQHCPYCFALAGDAVDPDEPTLEEISAKYDWLLEQGEEGREFNIQLSGGEPTVREDLPEIIKMAKNKGFSYVQINSNGRRLAEEEGYAKVLRDAGASVIFMQFDGTRDDIYMKLRGEALFDRKVQAIRNCEKAGLAVTLVPTVVRGVNDDNIGEMMDFLVENVNVVKGIHFQPASFFGRYPEGDELEGRITMFGLLRELEKQRPQFRYEDSLPISTGHTLCCFYSTYIKEPDGSVRCTLTKKQKQEGVSCCDAQSADSCCCDGPVEEAGCCDDQSADTCCCDAQDGDTCSCDTQGADTCCCDAQDGDTCSCDTQGADICCCDVQDGDTCSCDTQGADTCCCDSDKSTCDCGQYSGVVTVGCCDMTQADQLEVIRKDRDYVLDKWDIAVPDGCCSEETEDDECLCCSGEQANSAYLRSASEGSTCCSGEPAGSTCCSGEPKGSTCCSGASAGSTCCSGEPEGSTCCSGASAGSTCCSGEPKYKSSLDIVDMDEFLTYYKRNTFTVTGMAFQDITNLDAQRLKRCRVVQLTDDNRLIPFCAYNTIYR